jgi:hypothetical protein
VKNSSSLLLERLATIRKRFPIQVRDEKLMKFRHSGMLKNRDGIDGQRGCEVL